MLVNVRCVERNMLGLVIDNSIVLNVLREMIGKKHDLENKNKEI